ncbi:Signal-transducing adaptor protein 2 [Nibea albiflora]|uniref:Signal-transducing adaptor protein 2 n=1 Tax=Nibea albiflora TaxID=240163 RepID=A0ACB7ENC6_NIBAL|nr:Signal-transducing adaptor protein 2 [Nibea albiflora]
MAKRVTRQRNQLPTCYYEGFLEKRSFKDKTSRKLWTCLCGNTLFFFNDKRDAVYIEKLDLSEFVSITDDSSQDRNLEAARLNLQMKDENIKLTVPNAEARELWKGYIQSVAERSVPPSLNLLPGQIHMLKEAVEKEKERTKSGPPSGVDNFSVYVSLKADMPTCYHNVSRMEAEMLLEREAKRGNLLLRPGRGENSFAVSTRQDLDGPIFKHYRVTRKLDGGFAIDVDNPVMEKTDGFLIPLIMEEHYEKNISYVRSDDENGEKSVQQANLVPPSLPTRPAPLARINTAEEAPAVFEDKHLYINDKQAEKEKKKEDSSVVPLSQVQKNPPKKAMMPPVPAPRRFSPPPSTSSTNVQEPTVKACTDDLGQIHSAAISELKAKLGQKLKCKE